MKVYPADILLDVTEPGSQFVANLNLGLMKKILLLTTNPDIWVL